MISVSELLKKSWMLYKEHAQLLIGLIAWLLIPSILIVLLETISFPAVDVLIGIVRMGEFLFGLWIMTAVLFLLPALIKKESYVLKQIFAQSLHILPSLILLELLFIAVVFGGFLLLIIPGLLFLVWFAFAQFSLLFENKKGIQALIASRHLVQKRFWGIAWRLFAGPALIGFFYFLLVAILVLIFSGINQPSLDQIPLLADLISTIVEIFFVPFFLIYSFLLYQEAKDTYAS